MLRTDDLFLEGLALTRGGELVGVDVRGQNGRRVAVFTIAGPEVEQAERDYYRGTTSVDLQLFKLQVRRLKDRAFEALRQERPQAGPPYRPSRIHAGEGGSTTRRPAEDADVGATGAARGEEERRGHAEERERAAPGRGRR